MTKTLRQFGILSILFLGLTPLLSAQESIGVEWLKGINGSGSPVEPQAVTRDAQGNLLITGTFGGQTDFDPGPGSFLMTSTSRRNLFVAKLNPSGSLIWARSMPSIDDGGLGESSGQGIAADPSGNVYITGFYSGKVDFNPGPGQYLLTSSSSASRNIFIQKLNQDGNFLWVKEMGSGPQCEGNGIHVDGSGNIYSTGLLRGTVDFDPGPGTHNLLANGTGTTSPNTYIQKLDTDGNFLWAKNIWNSEGNAIARDGAGNIYVTGHFSGTVDFDPGASTHELVQEGGQANAYVLKLYHDGNFAWARSIRGRSAGMGIKVDANQNVFTTGFFSETADLDPGTGEHNLTGGPGFLQKLDIQGNFVWASKLSVGGGSIEINAGSLYITGKKDFTLNFPSSVAQSVQKLDASGTLVWQKTLNGAVYGTDLTVDDAGNTYAIGYNADPITGDGACNYTLPAGAFIVKLNENEFPAGFAVSANTLSPLEQTTCVLGIPGVITGTHVQVNAPAGESRVLVYQWQEGASATGPWTDIPGEIFKDLQPLSGNVTRYYRRQVKAISAYCELKVLSTSAVATVEVNSNVAPVANADGPQWFVCGEGNNTVTLNGSATGPGGDFTFKWYQGSPVYGVEVGSNASFMTPGVTTATTYTLQVTDAQGCVDIEQVTIVPAIAAAGADRSLCQGQQGVQIGSPPVADPAVTYAWEVVSGTAGSLSCTTCAQPVATPTADTQYRLTVTVKQKDNTQCSTTSTVWVRPVSAPDGLAEFAGSDKTICHNETVVLGGAGAGAGYNYTWSSGQYLSSASIYNPTFNAGTAHASCPMVYTVSATKDGCTFTDEVKVSVIEPAIEYQGETKCGPRWVGSRETTDYNCSSATYEWTRVSGTGTIQETRNRGQEAFLVSTDGKTTFRRTVTLNGVSCSADIEIEDCADGRICEFELVTLSAQGCPKVFGEFAELIIGTRNIDPRDYDFQWSPADKVSNAASANVTITSAEPFTLTLTATHKLDPSIQCTRSIEVNPPGWSLPDFTIEGGSGCAGTPIEIGTASVAGYSYRWSGDQIANLSNTTISNPVATLNAPTFYNLVVTEDATGCANTFNVPVNVSSIFVDAGPDRAVCNGGTATLGMPAPSGTNWTYQWQPSGAAWANNTTSTDAQPQIIFSFASPQTFTVTATDPVTGCTATDQVVVRNEQEEDEYSGADQETCVGVPVTLGTTPIPGASYAWFNADGVTPATGLSCTTCAQPVFTNPQATTKYVVKVSFGETCTTPLIAEVDVTVNQVTGVDLADRDMCGNTGVEIGFGNGINPPAPAGATFQWLPATGLNDPAIANPTANVTEETVYTVIVTLESGCEFRDQVRVKPIADKGPDRTICAGESVVLGGTPVAGTQYSWTGAGIVGPADVANPTVRPSVTTTYTLTATTGAGCEITREVTVTVSIPVDFNITANTTICAGGVATVGISGPVPPNTLWQWSPVDGVQNPESPNTTIAATSTKTYTLTQVNLTTGCSNAKEIVIVVNPGINVTSEDLSLCPGERTKTMVLNVTGGSNNYQYTWSPAEGLSNPFIANPVVTPSVSTTYSVTVTDLVSGCQFIRSVEVDVKTGEECESLPVTLVSFDVKKEGAAAHLTWKTSSEVNSSYFDIEQSRNAREWRTIGRVPAAGERGIFNSYSFTDAEPNEGMNYYRLKMVDLDGTFAYSETRSSIFETPSIEVTVAPNPVSDILHIKTNDWKNVRRVDILNMGGQTVYQSQEIPFQEVNVATLPGGIYMVKITRKNGTLTFRKIVIAR